MNMFLSGMCRTVFVVLLVTFSTGASFAANVTLTDPQTGLTVSAPKGYSLKFSNGAYTLRKGKNYARFMLARSPLSLKDTASSFAKLSKISVKKRSNSSKSVTIEGKLKKRSVKVVFKQVGSFVDIVTYGTLSSSKQVTEGGAGYPLRPEAITAQDIAQINRVLNTRRGGITVPLQVTIPMVRRTAPDNGSSALVPNLPGWSFSGGGGVVAGGNANQGLYSLGVPVVVGLPGFGAAVQSNPVGPDVAIVQVWPQYAAVTSGAQVQVLQVRELAGTAGWLGPNFLSAMYAVRFVLNGRVWVSLMVSGVFDMGSSIGWGWYQSFIAVPEDGPGGIMPALLQTWASWDNSNASAARLAQAVSTLASIRVNGFPIDPKVFEKTANAWSEYIRE